MFCFFLVLFCQVVHPEEKWDGLTGYVDEPKVKDHLPKPSEDGMIFVCGPPGMMKVKYLYKYTGTQYIPRTDPSKLPCFSIQDGCSPPLRAFEE